MVPLGGVVVWGLRRGSGYDDWNGKGAPSLLMCLERLVTLQSTGDSRLDGREKTHVKRSRWRFYQWEYNVKLMNKNY